MRFLYLAILLITIYSCEKRIDFTPEIQAPKLVVEAVIENSQHPVVSLTRSLDFFSRISREQLTGSFEINVCIPVDAPFYLDVVLFSVNHLIIKY